MAYCIYRFLVDEYSLILKKMKINVVAHARCIFSLFDIFSVTALNDGTRKSPCVNGCLMYSKQKKNKKRL